MPVGEVRQPNATIAGSPEGIDPGEYLDRLADLAAEMPAGARTFATDPDHYDFFGPRCAKDLKLLRIRFGDHEGEAWAEASFRHNCCKHDEDLAVRYLGVRTVTPNAEPIATDIACGAREVILDEVLPHPLA